MINPKQLIPGKSVLKNEYGRCLVLEVGACTVVLSEAGNFTEAMCTYHFQELEKFGYTLEEPEQTLEEKFRETLHDLGYMCWDAEIKRLVKIAEEHFGKNNHDRNN